MKKILFFALLVQLMMGLSVTSAHALVGVSDACNPEIHEMMHHHSDAMRVRDKAQTSEHIKREEPMEGLTCFDQQLKITAHLGSIFSDKRVSYGLPTSPQFCGMQVPMSSTTLGAHLGDVVIPMVGKWLGNFLHSIFSSEMFTKIMEILGVLQQTGFRLCIPTISITGIIHLPHFPLPACLPPMPAIPSLGLHFGGQCVSLPIPVDLSCDRLMQFWNSHNPTGGIISIGSGGSQEETPYRGLKDLLTRTFPGAGVDFMGQLDNNQVLLNAALRDLDKLKGPGDIVSWKKSPNFPASTDDPDKDIENIIRAMGIE